VQADEQSIGRVAELEKELGSQEADEQTVWEEDELLDQIRQGNLRPPKTGLRCKRPPLPRLRSPSQVPF